MAEASMEQFSVRYLCGNRCRGYTWGRGSGRLNNVCIKKKKIIGGQMHVAPVAVAVSDVTAMHGIEVPENTSTQRFPKANESASS
jgi:hypothetical protein